MGIDGLDNVNKGLVDAISVEGLEKGLWVNFVKGLLPIQEEDMEGAFGCFS